MARELKKFSQFIQNKLQLISDKFYTPCDPRPLALFRIAFGFLMLLDIPQERGLEDADIRFGDENYCFFPLFNWIEPLSVQHVCVLYSLMWAGGFGMMVGCKFRLSCLSFVCPYLYLFLLDKSRWNNHSYLFALLTILLGTSSAGHHLSIDSLSLSREEKNEGVPFWNYFLLKFQIFLLYFIAGIKKLDSDWISGYSMKNLSRHQIFNPIKLMMDGDVIEYYFVHLGGLAYDLSVGFMLNFQMTKKLAFLLSLAFHALNSQIFDIGMFPYVCLASLLIFCKADEFPCSFLFPTTSTQFTKLSEKSRVNCKRWKKEETWKETKTKRGSKPLTPKGRRKTLGLIALYVSIQLFMPFSHFITQGYNNWTPGLYGYSWDMMINSWETLHQKITVRNRITGEERYLDPDVWVANDRWSSHADMAIQYAECIERNLARFNISDIEVYFDIWKSLNGRFQQRIYDPRVDILKAPWSPFQRVEWILPLLGEFSHYRRDLFESIGEQVSNWTLASDVIFVADFPGLYLENYLPLELTNITITLISGEILVEQEGMDNVTLTTFTPWNSKGQGQRSIQSDPLGNHHQILSGKFHKIHTRSFPHPSSYMYTYTNATEEAIRIAEKEKEATNSEQEGASNLFNGISKLCEDFKEFLWEKLELFSRSVYLVINAYLNLFFGVPMVIRKSL